MGEIALQVLLVVIKIKLHINVTKTKWMLYKIIVHILKKENVTILYQNDDANVWLDLLVQIMISLKFILSKIES